jgi:hypothetical protein
MENIITKIKKLPMTIESAYSEELSELAGYLLIDFDIKFRNTEEKVNKDMLVKYIKNCVGIRESVCAAVTRAGTRCTSKANQGSKYCKRHVNKELFDIPERDFASEKKENVKIDFCVTKVEGKSGERKKQFIEDTFYYIDKKYIYNMETMEKEGYIKDEEYVLTRDPFILNCE